MPDSKKGGREAVRTVGYRESAHLEQQQAQYGKNYLYWIYDF